MNIICPLLQHWPWLGGLLCRGLRRPNGWLLRLIGDRDIGQY